MKKILFILFSQLHTWMGTSPVKVINHYYYPKEKQPSPYNINQASQNPNSTNSFKPVNDPRKISVFKSNPGKYKEPENNRKMDHDEVKRNQSQKKHESYQIQQKQFQNKNCEGIEEKIVDERVQNLQKIIEQYEVAIEKAKQYGRKMQDVTKYQEFKKQSLDVFVKNLKQMGLQELAISKDGICKKIIVGKISSGKSSLINNLLGTNLETGMGQTTEEVSLVYDSENIQIYDTPGENEQFNTQKIDRIKLIASVNEVFILYPDSLKNSEHLIRVITAIKPKHTYLIRTHCDKANKKDNKTLEEEIQTDYRILEKWNIHGVPIYTTSNKGKDLFQNQDVLKLLLRDPRKI